MWELLRQSGGDREKLTLHLAGAPDGDAITGLPGPNRTKITKGSEVVIPMAAATVCPDRATWAAGNVGSVISEARNVGSGGGKIIVHEAGGLILKNERFMAPVTAMSFPKELEYVV